MNGTKRCTACLTDLMSEAARCPTCGTEQPLTAKLHRGEGRALAGVCSALAREFGVDVGLVRVAFVLTLLFSGGTALLVYSLLWAFLPASAMEKPPVRKVVDWLGKVTNAEPDEPRIENRV
ncbi:PspC domain-containing protein [Myxococcaceae bacterium GXIMD 01537]